MPPVATFVKTEHYYDLTLIDRKKGRSKNNGIVNSKAIKQPRLSVDPEDQLWLTTMNCFDFVDTR